MLETVLHTIQDHRLIPSGSVVVVGVSGGPDSLALLHVLHRLAGQLNCRLHVATFDHGLRNAAGADDVRFVEQIAHTWQLSVTTGRVDVERQASNRRVGIEAAAREARYNFLATTAREIGTDRIAVAHHADDQAETVLMHILRGTGIKGLSGMPLSAYLPGSGDLILIRPLLKVTRHEVEAYCQQQDLCPRHDATNQDLTFLRNRIRWETLPSLQTINPEISRALNRLADNVAVDNAYLEQEFQKVVEPHLVWTEGRVVIDRAQFDNLHPALQRHLVYNAAHRLGGTVDDLGHQHITNAVQIASDRQVGALALLPGGLQLRVDYQTIAVERASVPPPVFTGVLMSREAEIPVCFPGLSPIPGTDHRLRIDSGQVPTSYHARLAIPAQSELRLRTRRPGDRFAPLGLDGHTRKVGRWMIDRKIPKSVRDLVPLLLVNGQIAAILIADDWAISDLFAVRDFGAQPVIYLSVERS
jgi:tRNA(Ile)-lysidine synthase